VSSKDHPPCEKWDHCDFLGWVHLVLRLKEGSSAALWKGSEIRPCNKQFISNSPVPYTRLYLTITVAATSDEETAKQIWFLLHFLTIRTFSSLLCLQQPANGCSKINVNVILPFMATYFKWPLFFKLADQGCICIKLLANLNLLQVSATWVENSDLCKNYYWPL